MHFIIKIIYYLYIIYIYLLYITFILYIKIQVHMWKPKEDKLKIKTLEKLK